MQWMIRGWLLVAAFSTICAIAATGFLDGRPAGNSTDAAERAKPRERIFVVGVGAPEGMDPRTDPAILLCPTHSTARSAADLMESVGYKRVLMASGAAAANRFATRAPDPQEAMDDMPLLPRPAACTPWHAFGAAS